MLRVAGFCPMGCGESLLLGEGGFVTCCSLGCPAPDAVARILADPEAQHVVEVDADGFSVKHPLRERLDDELMSCRVFTYLTDPGWPQPPPGRYRAVVLPDGLDWLPQPPA